MPLLASEVMDEAAAVYLNDAAKARWPYSVLLPYLRSAVGELQAELESNDLPPLYEIAVTITMNVGEKALPLPADFVFPIYIEERSPGESRWKQVDELSWDPDIEVGNDFRYYVFREGNVTFPGANQVREIRLRYLRSLSAVATSNSVIEVPNAKQFLAARTASLASNFGGSATQRATMADARASYFLRLLIGALTKRLQNRPVRRRGYRGSRRY